MKYVTVKKFSELSGYTQDGIRGKIKNGKWLSDRHWKKAPDGRILINVKEVEKWIES